MGRRILPTLVVGGLLIFSAVSFGQIATPTPSTAVDYFQLGVADLKTGRFREAITALEASARLDPNRPETYANEGSAYIALKDIPKAVVAYRKAVAISSKDARFHVGLCEALALDHDRIGALAECKEGVRLAPDSIEANANLIALLPRSDTDLEETAKQVDAIVARLHESLPILERAARFYEAKGDLAHAIELYAQASALQPNNAYYLALLAELSLRSNRESDAVAFARRALQIDSREPIANFFMGKLFLEFGLNSDARDSFSIAATAEDPAIAADARYYLAESNKRLGRFQEALAPIREAATREPNNFIFQREYADLLHSLRKFPDAIEQYQRALRLQPKDAEAGVGLALSYFGTSNYAEAVRILEDLARQRPDDHEVVGMLLEVARTRLSWIPLIDQAEESASKEPGNIQGRVELIGALAFAGRTKEMDSYTEQVWKLGPKDVRQVVRIAVAYLEAGETQKAEDTYQRGLAIADDGAIYLGLAGIYAERGEVERAFKAYDKVIELKANVPDIMKMYADLLRDNGKRTEALAMYSRSLALKPSNPPVLFNAALLSLKLGDPVTARAYLEQLRGLDPSLAGRLDRMIRMKLWAAN